MQTEEGMHEWVNDATLLAEEMKGFNSNKLGQVTEASVL